MDKKKQYYACIRNWLALCNAAGQKNKDAREGREDRKTGKKTRVRATRPISFPAGAAAPGQQHF